MSRQRIVINKTLSDCHAGESRSRIFASKVILSSFGQLDALSDLQKSLQEESSVRKLCSCCDVTALRASNRSNAAFRQAWR